MAEHEETPFSGIIPPDNSTISDGDSERILRLAERHVNISSYQHGIAALKQRLFRYEPMSREGNGFLEPNYFSRVDEEEKSDYGSGIEDAHSLAFVMFEADGSGKLGLKPVSRIPIESRYIAQRLERRLRENCEGGVEELSEIPPGSTVLLSRRGGDPLLLLPDGQVVDIPAQFIEGVGGKEGFGVAGSTCSDSGIFENSQHVLAERKAGVLPAIPHTPYQAGQRDFEVAIDAVIQREVENLKREVAGKDGDGNGRDLPEDQSRSWQIYADGSSGEILKRRRSLSNEGLTGGGSNCERDAEEELVCAEEKLSVWRKEFRELQMQKMEVEWEKYKQMKMLQEEEKEKEKDELRKREEVERKRLDEIAKESNVASTKETVVNSTEEKEELGKLLGSAKVSDKVKREEDDTNNTRNSENEIERDDELSYANKDLESEEEDNDSSDGFFIVESSPDPKPDPKPSVVSTSVAGKKGKRKFRKSRLKEDFAAGTPAADKKDRDADQSEFASKSAGTVKRRKAESASVKSARLKKSATGKTVQESERKSLKDLGEKLNSDLTGKEGEPQENDKTDEKDRDSKRAADRKRRLEKWHKIADKRRREVEQKRQAQKEKREAELLAATEEEERMERLRKEEEERLQDHAARRRQKLVEEREAKERAEREAEEKRQAEVRRKDMLRRQMEEMRLKLELETNRRREEEAATARREAEEAEERRQCDEERRLEWERRIGEEKDEVRRRELEAMRREEEEEARRREEKRRLESAAEMERIRLEEEKEKALAKQAWYNDTALEVLGLMRDLKITKAFTYSYFTLQAPDF